MTPLKSSDTKIRYTYLGDRWTRPELDGLQRDPVRCHETAMPYGQAAALERAMFDEEVRGKAV